ncbi:hypothetical protein COCSADRAFT_351630 [Bipolaris sorokiniana ND90Pr]|uniref:HTH CENPB-type domain-containing protein n=1 Tax=Cochliobolus sativus (strain ND90Pr / ATCC 201652) TaxID=665912 RepID=M2RK06_COCSN|nr:uncharacterized protein COCSADRAFT_351630 [Bipolaris sorokiniana ND90Pr]EMD67024.1 hypothetical protein COCSADRAFT_351630 [Bipolaris sorokiniana ND90Pr]
MDSISKAIAAIDSQGPEGQISYREAAKIFGVDRNTLARRHQNKTQSRDDATHQRQLLSPPQESELIKYIQDLTERALPPTRSIIKNYVSVIAEWEPSDSWISRFLRRHRDQLTTKFVTGID